MAKFPAAIELSSLDGSNGFKLSGVAANDLSGRSVASAGDVNGDGLGDLIVGASSANAPGTDTGASYVVFGRTGGFGPNIDLSSLNGSNGFKLSGVAADDNSGISVASAGDVNGDGFADVIIGAYRADPHGTNSGASYVVFGHAGSFGPNVDLSSLNGSNGFKLSGVAADDYSGLSAASAGDVNGDGFADVIIGALGADPQGSNSGASYVVFGRAGGFGANIDLSSLDGTTGFRLSGVAAGDFSGFAVASAGDVNGDGLKDLIIGAFRADPHGNDSGASYVVFGRTGGFGPNVDLSNLNGSNGFKLSGVAADDQSGRSVASAGDINGDGFADVIIGAYRADPHGSNSGASYVVFGHAGGFSPNIDLSSLNGSNGFKLSGVAADNLSGRSVASAGDVNGDGFADVIVGALGADPHGNLSGSSYVLFGHAGVFAANIDLSSLDGRNGFKLNGVAADDRSGNWVASAGDINGDGFADLAVGAYLADPHGINSGASYVVFGHATVNGIDGGFAGDLGGDGKSDIIVRNIAGGPVGVWQMDGFTPKAVQAIGSVGREWHVADNADFNGDNINDILWRADNGTVMTWQMQGGQLQTAKILGLVGNEWRIGGTGDFNGDNTDDILWQRTDGTLMQFQMQNGQIQSAPTFGKIGLEWHNVGIGDFNGDGRSDILWRRDDGTLLDFQMNGTQINAQTVGQIGGEWHVGDVADFGGDGKSDILWQNDNGLLMLWQMNGSQIQSSQTFAGLPVDWHLSGTADVDGDHRADILWRNDNGAVAAWAMNGASVKAAQVITPLDETWSIGVHHYDLV